MFNHTIRKNSFLNRFVSCFVVFVFVFTAILPPTYAQVLNLPIPGAMVSSGPAFTPVLLRGMTLNLENPLLFNFIVDSGNTQFSPGQIKEESNRLVKYFLAAMTVPQDDLWVNLSPYEENRIIPDELGKTELGRDMLAQDYLLKQLSATLMHPEKYLGKKFWKEVRQKVRSRFGNVDIPMDTFNKVWIIPDEASVYEHDHTVYITKTRLKVMTEQDYLAAKENGKAENEDGIASLQNQIIKEIIIPEIEREVNEGENFAPIRQIYNSLILAQWYKETVKEGLLSKVYVDQNKIKGVDLDDPTVKDQIYAKYIEAFKQGVFNFIKEDYDELNGQVIPRRYFSGGEKFKINIKHHRDDQDARRAEPVGDSYDLVLRIDPVRGKIDNAMLTKEQDAVERVVKEMVTEKGYDEQQVRLIINEHWRRLRQREPVDMTKEKWLDRMRLSVEWWMEYRKYYDYQLVNIFGDTPEKKKANVIKTTKEFKNYMITQAQKTGTKFFVYSGGSGVGKSTIWNELKSFPQGENFKKFLMYTTRERRPDEDPEFNKDLDLNSIDSSLARVINMILNEEIDKLPNVTVDNVSEFKKKLLNKLSVDGVSLSESAKLSIDKILDLAEQGENGRRIGQSPKNMRSGKDVRISLAERIGRIDSKKVRIYGEFDGVQYYFTDEDSLRNGDEGNVMLLPYGKLMQALSFEGINAALENESDEIMVLETTPENVLKIKKKFGEKIKSIFVSPFKKIAVVGASGFSGRRIYSFLRQQNQQAVIGTSYSEKEEGFVQLDVTDEEAVQKFIKDVRPDVVVYAAGVASPQEAEKDKKRAEYLNAGVVDIFHKYFDGQFIYLSSDYVFDGTKKSSYLTSDTPHPINFYGKTKLEGERAARQFSNYAIIRSGLLFGHNGPQDRMTFVEDIVKKIERGQNIEADNTQARYPVSIDDLARGVNKVIVDDVVGIQQLNGSKAFTKMSLARKIQRIYNEELSSEGEILEAPNVRIVPSKFSYDFDVPKNSQMKNSFEVLELDRSLRQTVRAVSKRLKGGSTNSIRVIRSNDGEARVRKESPTGSWDRDKKKFGAQVQWLLNLPADLRPFFPRVISHNLEVDYGEDKSKELLERIDLKTGKPSGQFITRNEAHQKGIAHKVVHIIIFNKTTGDILVQQRAQRPDVNAPGKIDFLGGHVGAAMNEDFVAIKEMLEEVKLAGDEYQLIKVGDGFRSVGSPEEENDGYIDQDEVFRYHSDQQKNNEYATLYIAVTDVSSEEINRRIKKAQTENVKAEALEVEGVRYISIKDLAASVEDLQSRNRYASPIRLYFFNKKAREIINSLNKEILGQKVDVEEGVPYYEMPLYEGRTITQSIIYDEETADFVIKRLRRILDFWKQQMLGARTESVPDNYIKEILIDRVRESLKQVQSRSPEVFDGVVSAEYLYINGKRYKNVLPLLDQLENNQKLMDKLVPPALRLVHGDFHFDNFFFKEDGGFLLLDPRGDYVGDPVYDLAKIAHTVIGKYDLLNYDLQKTVLKEGSDGVISISVEFSEESHAWKVYQELERHFSEIVEEYFGSSEFAENDPYWRQRLGLMLAKIMTNLPIYHLKNDGKEERALALYAEGVVFFNKFLAKMQSQTADSAVLSDMGGIDMNRINLDRKGRGIEMEIDSALMQDILTNGVDGFVPVIIDLTPINSVLPLLGLNPEEELGPANKQEELVLSSMN